MHAGQVSGTAALHKHYSRIVWFLLVVAYYKQHAWKYVPELLQIIILYYYSAIYRL